MFCFLFLKFLLYSSWVDNFKCSPGCAYCDLIWLCLAHISGDFMLPSHWLFSCLLDAGPCSSLAPILELVFTIIPKLVPCAQPPPLSPLSHLAVLLPAARQPTSQFIRCFISKEERSGLAQNDCFQLLISLFCARKHFCDSAGDSNTDKRNPLVNSNPTSFTGVHSWMSCLSGAAIKWNELEFPLHILSIIYGLGWACVGDFSPLPSWVITRQQEEQ